MADNKSSISVSDDSAEKQVQQNTSEKAVESEPATPTPQEDVPPNGGYGWVVVFCVFMINAHTWGMNSVYGVFLAYYLDNNVFPGATYLEYAFIGGLSISSAFIIAPLATITTRCFGTRITLLTGVFFETLSFIASSFTKRIWQLFLSQGVCFGIGMGFLFVGSVGLVAQWFTTRRSLANGISAAGSGFGALIYNLATNAMIKNISLPWAFRILGIIVGVVNTTCSLLCRDRNKQVGSKHAAFDYRLLKRYEYWLFLFWGFFSMLGYVVLLFSLPNYATSIGLSQSQGSIVGALLNLGQGLGRSPVGYFSDSFGRLNMAIVTTFLPGLWCLIIWTNASGYGVLIFFAIWVGLVSGSYWATVAPVAAEVCGLPHLPSALSINWLFLVLPVTFSEPIGLEISQRSGAHYLGAQLFAGFMYVAAAMCLVPVRGWKIAQKEEAELRKNQIETGQSVGSPKPSTWMIVKNMAKLKRV